MLVNKKNLLSAIKVDDNREQLENMVEYGMEQGDEDYLWQKNIISSRTRNFIKKEEVSVYQRVLFEVGVILGIRDKNEPCGY